MPIFGIIWDGIILLFLFVTTINSNNDCPEGEGCTECIYSNNRGYILHCAGNLDYENFNPKYEVKYKVFDKDPKQFTIEIICRKPTDWSDFHLGEKKKIPQAENIKFERCHLPEGDKLSAIVKQLIFNPVSTLQFVSRNNLTSTLTRQTLADFKNIVILNLSNNKLGNVSADLLHNFNNLKELDLGSNDLYEIPSDFLNFPQLILLRLDENKLQIIKRTTFKNLLNLEKLQISGNNINIIEPQSFDNLNKLFLLNLRENKLTYLPLKIFHQLKNLKIIDLSKNEFHNHSFSSNLFENNQKLEVLLFSNNKLKLTSLPNNFFANLTNLKILNLEKNGFFYLPENLLFDNINLEELILKDNHLKKLPNNLFKYCKKLRILNLKNNIIEIIPNGTFSSLNNLEELILSENHITQVSYEIFGGLNIQKLDMSYNNIDFIPENAFINTNYLKIINFSNNGLILDDSIGTIEEPHSPFRYSVRSIEEIYLNNNNISTIFNDWMMATQLKILQLKNNQLDSLHALSLEFFSKETVEIDLQYNLISKINLVPLETLVSDNANSTRTKPIVNVNVAHNPIICDHKIYQILRYREGRMIEGVKNRYKISTDNLVCAEPKELKNISLKNLNSKNFTSQLTKTLIKYGIICPDKCDCRYRPEDRATLMNCSYRGFTKIPAILHYASMNNHIELNLSGNYLKTMPLLNETEMKNITVLSMSHNQITTLSQSELSKNYVTLHLHNNYLTKLDKNVMEFFSNSTKLQQLTLHENQWQCNCDTNDFLDFIQTKQLKYHDLQKVTCKNMNIPVYKMTPLDMCPLPIAMISGIAVALILVLIVSISTAIYYRHEQIIKVWLFHHHWFNWLVTEAVLDKDKIFDAFLSYSHKDEDFIVQTLVPNLENGPRAFKLCIHYRDWLGGEWIEEQIRRSVADSRRTIVVVSKNFLESEWGKVEFRTAHCSAIKEKRPRVIVIIYGDIGPIDKLESELQMYINTYTYIKWGDPWFWKKLKFSLPHHTDPIKTTRRDQNYAYTSPPTVKKFNKKISTVPINAV